MRRLNKVFFNFLAALLLSGSFSSVGKAIPLQSLDSSIIIKTPVAGAVSTNSTNLASPSTETNMSTAIQPASGSGCQSDADCNDGNTCTTDVCNPVTGSVYGNCTYETMANCNQQPTSTCGDGIQQTGEECDDGNQTNNDGCNMDCTFPCVENTQQDCDNTAGCAYSTDATLNPPGCRPENDSSTTWTGTQECQNGQWGYCVKSTNQTPTCPTNLDDSNPCTVDACDAAGVVSHTAVANGTSCDDGDICNGISTCQMDLTGVVCQSGTPVNSDDGNACTTDSCDSTNGNVQHDSIAGCCIADSDCDDSNACTTDTCTLSIGFVTGSCTNTAKDVPADTTCVSYSCNTTTGDIVAQNNDGVSCSDGNLCNGEETCQSGSCAAGTAIDDDDGNDCTTDSCDPNTGGITHENIISNTCGSCGDGVVQTSLGEECDAGVGITDPTCDSECHNINLSYCGDGEVQTEEECDPANTDVLLASGTSCSDTCVIITDRPCDDDKATKKDVICVNNIATTTIVCFDPDDFTQKITMDLTANTTTMKVDQKNAVVYANGEKETIYKFDPIQQTSAMTTLTGQIVGFDATAEPYLLGDHKVSIFDGSTAKNIITDTTVYAATNGAVNHLWVLGDTSEKSQLLLYDRDTNGKYATTRSIDLSTYITDPTQVLKMEASDKYVILATATKLMAVDITTKELSEIATGTEITGISIDRSNNKIYYIDNQLNLANTTQQSTLKVLNLSHLNKAAKTIKKLDKVYDIAKAQGCFQAACVPSTEVCDGIDNDCDNLVDEDLTKDCSSDCGLGTEICTNGTWEACSAPTTCVLDEEKPVKLEETDTPTSTGLLNKGEVIPEGETTIESETTTDAASTTTTTSQCLSTGGTVVDLEALTSMLDINTMLRLQAGEEITIEENGETISLSAITDGAQFSAACQALSKAAGVEMVGGCALIHSSTTNLSPLFILASWLAVALTLRRAQQKH